MTSGAVPGGAVPRSTAGEWYLHLFAPEQPDFNWANPEVRAEFEDVLRFWFARGADGIRINSAALLTKDPELPETGPGDPSPYSDRDDVHDIYRAWRAVADEYPGRVLIGGDEGPGGSVGFLAAVEVLEELAQYHAEVRPEQA